MLTEFFNFAFSEMKTNPVNPLQLIIIINKLFYNCSIIRENAFGRRKKTKKRTAKQNMRRSQRLLFINTDIIRGIKPTWDFPIYKIYLFFWHIRQENHKKRVHACKLCKKKLENQTYISKHLKMSLVNTCV